MLYFEKILSTDDLYPDGIFFSTFNFKDSRDYLTEEVPKT